MALSLQWLLDWVPEIGDLAKYAHNVASNHSNSAEFLRGVIKASTWVGEAGDTARASMLATVVDHDDQAERIGQGAADLDKAHEDAEALANKVKAILNYAADAPAVEVDTHTNTVTPPPSYDYLDDDAKAKVSAKIADLEAQIADALDEGDTVDDELALAIAQASGLPGPVHTADGEHHGVQLVDDKKHRWTDKDLYPHDPTAADVHQDSIGDCYLDSTMGAIANANPQWIKDRIHYDDKTGNFDVTLWDGHQWKHIPVTQDDISTDIQDRGASWLDNGQPNAALWPSVLESAYAKLKAPGRSLDDALKTIGKGGYSQDAMEALTGNRGTNINPQAVWFTNQHIDQDIATALANHQPVTISTTPHGVPLEQSHVYIVEGITGTGSDAQVTLRNPWETNLHTPINTPGPLVTVRLGDLIGSGLPTGDLPNGPFGTHPTSNVNIGHLG